MSNEKAKAKRIAKRMADKARRAGAEKRRLDIAASRPSFATALNAAFGVG